MIRLGDGGRAHRGGRQPTASGALHEFELRDMPDGIYESETIGRRGQKHRVYFKMASGRIAIVYRGKHDAMIVLNG